MLSYNIAGHFSFLVILGKHLVFNSLVTFKVLSHYDIPGGQV